jgi:NAD-dependent deacetylase
VSPRRVLVVTGAGVSAESGIPTFRGQGGYWRNFDPAKLATPEAFARDPQLIWEWYRERRAMIRQAEPNPAHHAIARLAREIPEFLLVTQNVDSLHARAGISAEKMVQIHGDIFVTKCSRCDARFREEKIDESGLPKCEKCGALMRPGVVWFGEQLDHEQIARVESFLEAGSTDITIVAGTTAMFGYILDWAMRSARQGGRLVEINPESTSLSELASEKIRQPAGIALPQLVDELIC